CGSIRAATQSAIRPSASVRSARSDRASAGGWAIMARISWRTGGLIAQRPVSGDLCRPLRDPFGDEPRERLEAVGQRGRSGLQNERGLDLAQETAADRGKRLKTRPGGEFRRLELLAAPGADHDVGGRRDHLPGGDDPLLRALPARELAEHVDA